MPLINVQALKTSLEVQEELTAKLDEQLAEVNIHNIDQLMII